MYGVNRGGNMEFLIALIIGGVIGWLASLMMGADAQMGVIANVIVGSVGSMLGHALANGMGLAARGPAIGYIVSILGAVALIALLRALGVFRRSASVR
jgi:uncharacterized membrane protein YeaQ/YmgE (transglycosylase-associated protein family)